MNDIVVVDWNWRGEWKGKGGVQESNMRRGSRVMIISLLQNPDRLNLLYEQMTQRLVPTLFAKAKQRSMS